MISELVLFTGKLAIFLLLAFLFLAAVLVLIAKAKGKFKEKLQIKNLSHSYADTKEKWLSEILSPKAFKAFSKEKKSR